MTRPQSVSLHAHERPVGHARPLRIALVGYGYWGPKVAAAVAGVDGAEIHAIVDRSPEQREQARSAFPRTQVVADVGEVLDDSAVEAVAVCTPVDTHAELALAVVRSRKHVFVEKPLSQSTSDAVELVRAAEDKGVTLMVDHTFLFEPAFQRLCREVDRGSVGEVRYIHAERLNFGRLQSRFNVIWSLGPHDVSMINHLSGRIPESVAASGICLASPDVADVVWLHMRYTRPSFEATVHLSWLDPRKVRSMTVIADRGMAVFDDTRESSKLAMHTKRISRDRGSVRLAEGPTTFPAVRSTEPLRRAVKEFVTCCRTGRRPLTHGWDAAAVVAVLEASNESLAKGGIEVGVHPLHGRDPGAARRLAS